MNPARSWHSFTILTTSRHWDRLTAGRLINRSCPKIEAGKPYTMIIPGCTYYRDECLEGNYHLYVSLLEGSGMPLLTPGDYVWGPGKDPILLGSGDQEIDLVLELVE